MSCFLDDTWEPETILDITGPVRWYNDIFIQLSTGQKVDPEDLKHIINGLYQEDLQCLFCKVKEKDDVLTFYTTSTYLFSDFKLDVEKAHEDKELSWYKIEVKELPLDGFDETLIKFSVKYWDAIRFFKQLVESDKLEYRSHTLDYLDEMYDQVFLPNELKHIRNVLKFTPVVRELEPWEIRRLEREEQRKERQGKRRQLEDIILRNMDGIEPNVVETIEEYVKLVRRDL